jgi:PAS domain S-box-containing protein
MAAPDGSGARWPATDGEGSVRRATDREHHTHDDVLLRGENRLLQMIARGHGLAPILGQLCRLVEEISVGALAAILLLDVHEHRLRHAVAPSLPKAYADALDGTVIGLSVGSCGTAGDRNEPVIVSDVATDRLWDACRDVLLAHDLRVCWSMPIRSSSGGVLGTFAIYRREPCAPGAEHYALIEQMAHVASIAIEHERMTQEIRRSHAELQQLIDFVPQHIIVLGPDGHRLHANKLTLEYTGHTLDEFRAADYDYIIHPDDLDRIRSEAQRVTAGAPFEMEGRMLGKDGRYRWFLLRYNPLCEDGRVVRWYVTGTDIDDRKEAEERVRKENIALRDEVDTASMFEEIVGASPALHRVLARVSKVAPTESTVLITGETGTGKELIARAIHKRSARAARAFVSVNCAGIPQSLIASELFGHEKGAFTGALQRRLGRFELADGGTLFLDEVGELPPETQVALLRVLQERQFERVGGNNVILAEVRLIAATNRDLQAAVAAGSFRADLFYRLNVFPIQTPPLRERKDDIPMLVEYFIARYAGKVGKKISGIDKKTLDLLRSYPWPGNIRELQNVIERSVILCETGTFSVDENWLSGQSPPVQPRSPVFNEHLASDQRALIEAALAEAKGRVSGPSGAAAKLGIPPSTLDSKIKALKIDKHPFKRV